MKHIYLKLNLICLAILGFSFVSCSSDDDDFAGKDNYIISLNLNKGGEIFTAAIQGVTISVTVPANTDLTSGVKAEIKLAELAKISPDPTSVSDWGKEQTFVVTSHNNSKCEYTYQVIYTDAVEKATIYLTTQKEVDDFGKKGIKAIDGNLIIGKDGVVAEEDIIHNLDGLKALQEVSKSITIKSSYQGEDLSGLVHLTSAGNIYLGTVASPLLSENLKTVELPALKKTSELVLHSANLENISLPQLRSAFCVQLIAEKLEQFSAPLLESVSNDFVMKPSTNSNTKNKSLEELRLEKLKNVGGSIIISNMSQTKTIHFSELAEIRGSFHTKRINELTDLDLKKLTLIGGSLELKEPKFLTQLELPLLTQAGSIEFDAGYNNGAIEKYDFSKLETVNGQFILKAKGNLKGIDFPALKTVQGRLEIQGTEQVSSLNFPQLNSCEHIYFYGLKKLKNLDLAKAKLGKLEIITCPALTEVKAMQIDEAIFNGGSEPGNVPTLVGITEIAGKLEITSYNQTKDFNFPNLKKVGHINMNSGISNGGSTLSFPHLVEVGILNASGTTLNTFEFPMLKKVTEKWSTTYFKFMKEGSIVIPKLTEVKVLEFKGAGWAGDGINMPLTNLDLFSELKKVETVIIENWGNLVDYKGLKNIIPTLEKENWKVKDNKYNPTFEQMLNGDYVQK